MFCSIGPTVATLIVHSDSMVAQPIRIGLCLVRPDGAWMLWITMTTRLSFLVARTICLLQAVKSEGIGQHLSRLYNHLVDMLVAQVLCSYRWICVETEDIHLIESTINLLECQTKELSLL